MLHCTCKSRFLPLHLLQLLLKMRGLILPHKRPYSGKASSSFSTSFAGVGISKSGPWPFGVVKGSLWITIWVAWLTASMRSVVPSSLLYVLSTFELWIRPLLFRDLTLDSCLNLSASRPLHIICCPGTPAPHYNCIRQVRTECIRLPHRNMPSIPVCCCKLTLFGTDLVHAKGMSTLQSQRVIAADGDIPELALILLVRVLEQSSSGAVLTSVRSSHPGNYPGSGRACRAHAEMHATVASLLQDPS